MVMSIRLRRLLLCLLALVLASEAVFAAALPLAASRPDEGAFRGACAPAAVAATAVESGNEMTGAAPKSTVATNDIDHHPPMRLHGHTCPHLAQAAISAGLLVWIPLPLGQHVIAPTSAAIVTRSVDPPLHPPRTA